MKKVTFLVVAILLYAFSFAQNASLKGVVTYYFNKYQGDKPDVGAKVFAVDSASYVENSKVLDSFRTASTYQSIYESSLYVAKSYKDLAAMIKGKKKQADTYADYMNKYTEALADAEKSKLKLMSINAFEKKDFNALDTRALIALLTAQTESNQNTTVDGVGNYSLSLPPNVYYIIVISNSRKRSTVSEIGGSFAVKKVDLKNKTQAEFSKKFDL